MDSCSSTDGCASTCSMKAPQATPVSPEITRAAEALACLLTDQAEFQNFVRLARVVRLDEAVNDLVAQINGYTGDTGADESELEERLEALPVVSEYRQAEQAARMIFHAVEEAISGAAGVPFAEHARPKACG